jgi:hypothetical protein
MFEERLNEKIPWCVSLNEKVSLEECKFMVFIYITKPLKGLSSED